MTDASASIPIPPRELRYVHYGAIVQGLGDTVILRTDPECDRPLPPIHEIDGQQIDPRQAPRWFDVIAWRSNRPGLSEVSLVLENERRGASARLLVNDGSTIQKAVASWGIFCHSDKFIVRGGRYRAPGDPHKGDWTPLRYDLPPFTIEGQAFQVADPDDNSNLTGLTTHLVDTVWWALDTPV